MKDKLVIGRIDKVDLQELHISELDAKIDTGAYSSAIHYNHAEVIEMEGKKVLRFSLLDPSHPEHNGKIFLAEDFDERDVKSSFGDSESRFVIHTSILIYGHIFTTDISLSNRGNLKFPLLLGRQLLSQGFLVDVNREYLSYKHKMEK